MLGNGSNVRDVDTLIFPFAACWRHYVELQLKSLIGECQQLLDVPMRARGGHNIEQLWSELRPLLLRAFPREDRTELRTVGRLLAQLAEMDPDSQAFRYAERRDGTPTLAGVDHLDIAEFHGALLGVAHYLEALDSALDHAKDLKSQALEYEWEVRSEYEEEMRQNYEY
jgi:hypothetical protein